MMLGACNSLAEGEVPCTPFCVKVRIATWARWKWCSSASSPTTSTAVRRHSRMEKRRQSAFTPFIATFAYAFRPSPCARRADRVFTRRRIQRTILPSPFSFPLAMPIAEELLRQSHLPQHILVPWIRAHPRKERIEFDVGHAAVELGVGAIEPLERLARLAAPRVDLGDLISTVN